MAHDNAPTLATNSDEVDVVAVAGGIRASAVAESAFMGLVYEVQVSNPAGHFVQRDSVTWGTMSENTEPNTQALDPTPRAHLCALHVADARVGPIGDAYYRSTGDEVQRAFVDEGKLSYANYFDSLCAALWAEPAAATEFGSATTVLSLGLIDTGLASLIAAGAPAPYALVIHSNLLPQLLAEPSIRELTVLGGRANGLTPVTGSPSNKLVVAGYAGVLDIFHSTQIVADTNARRNMMFSVGRSDRERCIANPWMPLNGPNGVTGQKMLVDYQWIGGLRSWDLMLTTFEQCIGTVKTPTTNNWMSTLATDDLV